MKTKINQIAGIKINQIAGINQIDKTKFWELCYLMVLTIYLLRQILLTTMFQIPGPWYMDQLIRLMIFGVVLLKTGYGAYEEGTGWFWCVVAAILYSISSIPTEYTFLQDTALLFIGAKDISYKKIVKIYVWCSVIVMAAAIFGAMTGCITDLIHIEYGEKYRHSFGVVYPTDFAAHLVYLVLAVWVAYEHIPGVMMAVISLILAGVAYYGCYAKCGAIVLILAAAAILYVSVTGYFAKKSSRIATCLSVADRLLSLATPICMVVMCALMVYYDGSKPWMSKINSAITGRLQLASSAYEKYGIKLFGTAFDMIGANTTTTISNIGYNFVDTSYCMVLLRYGIPTLLALTLLMVKMSWDAKKCKNERIIVALAVVAVHSMIEHHMTELAYNIFLILPFTKFDILKTEEESTDKKAGFTSRDTVFSCIYYVIIAVGSCLFMPIAVSYGKTIVSLFGLYESWRYKYFIVAVTFVLLLYIAFFETIRRCIISHFGKNKLTKRRICLLLSETVLLMCVLLGSKFVIRSQAGKLQNTVEGGAKVLGLLASDDKFDGKIYVDDYPVIYSEESGNITNSVLTGEAHCKEENIVIITGKKSELRRLIQKGFSFGHITDDEYVYTNSEEALNLLREYGIDMKSYFDLVSEVDMEDAATSNELVLTEDGKLLIEGEEHSLIKGPGVSIFAGKLKVEYRFKLLETQVENGTVARIKVSSYEGERICTEQDITRDMFDENGECTYVSEFDMGDLLDVEFQLLASGDTKIEVEEIRYGKVG